MRWGATAIVVLLAAPAAADPVIAAYELEMSGNPNTPFFKFTNLAPFGGPAITSVGVTLGDAGRGNFDSAIFESFSGGHPAVDVAQRGPDDNGSGGVRADFVAYDFGPPGLGAGGRWFRFRCDVDPDTDDELDDYRRILFDVNGDGGLEDNALVTVRFAHGWVIEGRLPDFAEAPDGVYRFGMGWGIDAGPELPEPSGPSLAAAAGLFLARRRRQGAAGSRRTLRGIVSVPLASASLWLPTHRDNSQAYGADDGDGGRSRAAGISSHVTVVSGETASTRRLAVPVVLFAGTAPAGVPAPVSLQVLVLAATVASSCSAPAMRP